MTTRTAWPYPDLRNGSTLHHITDTHFGNYAIDYGNNWLARVQADLEDLKIAVNAGHLHTGDMIDWYWNDTPQGENGTDNIRIIQEGWYKTFRDAIKAVTGLPWAEAVGNHDLLGTLNPDKTRNGRTSDDWAAAMDLASPNNAYDMGEIRVLTIAPPRWDQPTVSGAGMGDYVLAQATLDWLDGELSADTRPTMIGCHVTLQEQFDDDALDPHGGTANGVNPGLTDLIGAHDNVVGWLSGHRHNDIVRNPAHAETITVAGRQLFGICGPSGGGMNRFHSGNARQWGSPGAISMFLTLLDDTTLDVRWRNHNVRTWVPGFNGQNDLLLTRAA